MNEITRIIPLTQGKVAIVSEEDFEWALQYSWFAAKKILKRRVLWRAQHSENQQGRIVTFYLHREIGKRMGFDCPEVDHWDMDGLNCRRGNLRPASKSQNQQNRGKRIGCSSRFKGVAWISAKGKWIASIKLRERSVHITLGAFLDEIEAARCYDAAARTHFGAFARLNFPNAGEVSALA